jgi:hypothetical protein
MPNNAGEDYASLAKLEQKQVSGRHSSGVGFREASTLRQWKEDS